PTASPSPTTGISKKPSGGNGHKGNGNEEGNGDGNGSGNDASTENKKDTGEGQKNKEEERQDAGDKSPSGNGNNSGNGSAGGGSNIGNNNDSELEETEKEDEESARLTVKIKKPVMKETESVQAAEGKAESEITYTIGKRSKRGGFFAQPAVKVITVTVSSVLFLAGIFALLLYFRRSVKVYNDDGEGRMIYLGRCMVSLHEEGYVITIKENMVENSCTNRYCIKPGFFKIGKKEGQELIIYKEGKKTTAYLDTEMIVII
ncbi:MAG: hypothetical protein K2G19_10570, partial [Lachnospiraceae bacterium]|nr:hypothetical protein [Lachnospiraceae bacterium]